ncbi:LysM peptidoglycan-binding domain-containing protein (plasmid) [Pedobacter sp. BS3]|uniref:glucosaminidase domain-containing protein n=1 Tax=Pedobacter sp. BS3 TaxID=2567937 RepID=UPI0011EF25E8|nr:glucosaminidase domain-containing protein [Pedobacter sp. BS3]TZF86040.1 LysM peptidoglycan-binding domain-containing protein [Pedobacter sp. BS3]
MLKRLITACLLFAAGTSFGQSAAERYIQLYKDDAIRKMNEYGIPASIILGVAMHESGSGTSKIAKYLNNHFGIKGRNENRQIRSSYKSYDSVDDSYDDFISMLKRHIQFSRLFERYSDYDYKSWAKGIQRGGYARSQTWASQVLAIINKYQLYRFDNRPGSDDATAYIRPVESVPVAKTYNVKAGDTLNGIAKKFDTTVKDIRDKNALSTTNLSVGQKLKL